MAAAVLMALGVQVLTGSGIAHLLVFFPGLLAITFYSGARPAVIGWVLSVCAAAAMWKGVITEQPPYPERWTVLIFAASSAISIVIGARARRAALAERTELLRVEEQAQHDVNRAEENKHLALSKLSHDLRTPLSTIIGWAQVLRAQNPPQQMLHGLEVIERNARTQTRIIQELLEGKQVPAESSANDTSNTNGTSNSSNSSNPSGSSNGSHQHDHVSP